MGKKCLFFGHFGMLCFLETSVFEIRPFGLFPAIYYLIILNHHYRGFTDKRCQKIVAMFLSHFNKILQVIGNLIILPHFPTNTWRNEQQLVLVWQIVKCITVNSFKQLYRRSSFGGHIYHRLDTILSDGILSETQPAITCLKLTIETLEEGVKYVQS